jgi:hypothetical protein
VYAHHSLHDEPADGRVLVIGGEELPGAVLVPDASLPEERDFLRSHLGG